MSVLRAMFGTGTVSMRVLVSRVALVHTKTRGSARFVPATLHLLLVLHIVSVQQERPGSMEHVRHVETGISVEGDH